MYVQYGFFDNDQAKNFKAERLIVKNCKCFTNMNAHYSIVEGTYWREKALSPRRTFMEVCIVCIVRVCTLKNQQKISRHYHSNYVFGKWNTKTNVYDERHIKVHRYRIITYTVSVNCELIHKLDSLWKMFIPPQRFQFSQTTIKPETPLRPFLCKGDSGKFKHGSWWVNE